MKTPRLHHWSPLAAILVSGSAAIVGGARGDDRQQPSRTKECAVPRAGWLWCDDFEQDRLSRYFEYDNADGRFVRVAGVGVEGSFGMRARWTASGQVSAGFLHLAMGRTPQAYIKPVDAGTTAYREIFWRMYLRLQPGWQGGGADKLSRAISLASSNWQEAMAAHLWSGTSPGPDQDYLTLDPAGGAGPDDNLRTTKWNDAANMRWLGQVRGTTPLFAESAAGRWYCVEAHARLNDPGQSNGVFELWIDGALDARATGLDWVGRFSAYGINAVFFENYWNAGAVQPQERYFDNIVVSLQRIGC